MKDSRTEDRTLGAAATIVGVGLVTTALRHDPSALQFQAGMDGAVVAVVVGTILARLHGLRFRTALTLMAPIVAVQMLVMRAVGYPVAPGAGLELTIIGMLGVAFGGRGEARAPEPAKRPAERRAERTPVADAEAHAR